MAKNPLINDIDLDKLGEALADLEPTEAYPWRVPQVIIDAAHNWMEHCTLEQLRKVLDVRSDPDYTPPEALDQVAIDKWEKDGYAD